VALQCAQAVSEVAKVAGDSTAPYVQDLLAGLLAELPGRLWEVGFFFSFNLPNSEVLPAKPWIEGMWNEDFLQREGLNLIYLHGLPGCLQGKEAVLEAIGNLCEGCSKAISPHANKSSTAGLGPDSVIAAVSAASSRKKSSFRNAAFACLEQVEYLSPHTHMICMS
jgi:hypothetical protein